MDEVGLSILVNEIMDFTYWKYGGLMIPELTEKKSGLMSS